MKLFRLLVALWLSMAAVPAAAQDVAQAGIATAAVASAIVFILVVGGATVANNRIAARAVGSLRSCMDGPSHSADARSGSRRRVNDRIGDRLRNRPTLKS